MNNLQGPSRSMPYEGSHRHSQRKANDRVNYRPKGLRGLLRWATRQWELESPARIHDRDTADDGTPDHAGEFQGYVGLSQKTEPNNWQAVACRLDSDGYHITPIRCAVERIADEGERALARDICTNLYWPGDVAMLHGLSHGLRGLLMEKVLERLWDSYAARPWPKSAKPGWVDLSESQQKAIEAA